MDGFFGPFKSLISSRLSVPFRSKCPARQALECITKQLERSSMLGGRFLGVLVRGQGEQEQ